MLCIWNDVRARAARDAGTYGAWNGPVATTTWSAVMRPAVDVEDERPSSAVSDRDRAAQLDRELESRAYCSR